MNSRDVEARGRIDAREPLFQPRGTLSFLETFPGRVVAGVVAVLVGLAFWQALVQLHALPTYMLPAPSAVWTTGWALTRNGSLWHHVSITLAEAMLGFAIAFAVGASTAYPLAKSRLVASILSPYIAGTQAMPIIALAPLLLVWFGFGLVPKAIICALIVFFPILINTAVGLRTVDQAAVEAAQTEGANAWQILWHVEVPMGLRTILSGIRIGLTLSITGAIVAEFVASAAGLGYLMTLARSQYDSPLLFVACLSVVALAVLGYLVVGLLEIALIDWD